MGGTRQWDPSEDAEANPPEDDSAAVLRTVGRVIKKFRERAALTQTELGEAIGYGMEQVSSVERGRRAPSPEFLTAADEVLGAGGVIAELRQEAERARYPKKVRDVEEIEAKAVELCSYETAVIDGLLQTEEYARALFRWRRPLYTPDELEQRVSARMARQGRVGEGASSPIFTFVQDESTLLRPVGGKAVLRRQLEHLLEVSKLRNVDIQVMPLASEDNAGIDGSFRLLRLTDGCTVALTEVQLTSHVISEPKPVQIMDMRFGRVRTEALTPSESRDLIKRKLEEL